MLGLNSESALFRRCIREYSDRQNYRNLDLEYISSATLTDEFFRQNVAPKKILNSNELTSELFRSQGQSLPQEDSDLISIDRLIKPGYESKGQLAD